MPQRTSPAIVASGPGACAVHSSRAPITPKEAWMRLILDAVDRAAADFAEHPFLASLDYAASLDRLKRFAPGLTFWVLAYQDVLRIHEELARDPLVRRVASTLRQNDRGDDLSF